MVGTGNHTPAAFDGTPYRSGSAVVILRGDRRGFIGQVLAVGRRDGQATGYYMVGAVVSVPGSAPAVMVHHSDLVRAAHPASWYEQAQDRHGPCARCSAVDAALAAAR